MFYNRELKILFQSQTIMKTLYLPNIHLFGDTRENRIIEKC